MATLYHSMSYVKAGNCERSVWRNQQLRTLCAWL